MTAPGSHARIARNTLMLYIRQVVILFVSLYTVRVVLAALGVDDYGLYNVVAGVVTLFSFLSGTMASATQRYFAFALGENDKDKLKRIFVVNGAVYLAIAIVAFLLLETVGLWFVRDHLHVPAGRIPAVLLIYQFSILGFLTSIVTAPFMAIIIAHEDMQLYAYVSIVEALAKLGVVFSLGILPWDKLAVYGFLQLLVAVVMLVLYVGYCVRKYEECRPRPGLWDRAMFREIVAFTGWTLFGQVSTVARNQAVTILLNQVFNPATVAARAIALNITSQVNLFSNSFNVGLYPSIIKTYAARDRDGMFTLVVGGSRITFHLLWIFALPMYVGMDAILHLWLGSPPAHSALFTRLALVEVLIMSISMPLTTAARAPGDMRTYELSLGTVQLAIFAVSWIVLKMGYPAHSVFVTAILANIAMFFLRLVLVRNLISLPVGRFLREVIPPVAAVVGSSSLFAYLLGRTLPSGDIYIALNMGASFVTACAASYGIGLTPPERAKVNTAIRGRLDKVFPR